MGSWIFTILIVILMIINLLSSDKTIKCRIVIAQLILLISQIIYAAINY